MHRDENCVKISTSMTGTVKRTFPFLMILGLIGLVYEFVISIGDGGEFKDGEHWSQALFLVLIWTGIIYYFYISHIKDIVDEVYYCDKYILVKNKDKNAKFKISEIENLEVPPFYQSSPYLNISKIILKKPHPYFGKTIKFGRTTTLHLKKLNELKKRVNDQSAGSDDA